MHAQSHRITFRLGAAALFALTLGQANTALASMGLVGIDGWRGALLPLLLQRFGIDPALAGGVILTTVTDVVGFLSFLGLATLFLV